METEKSCIVDYVFNIDADGQRHYGCDAPKAFDIPDNYTEDEGFVQE